MLDNDEQEAPRSERSMKAYERGVAWANETFDHWLETGRTIPPDLPLTESLKDTVARFLPYWHESIAPRIQGGERVLIAAHGNSLRALVKYLDNISDQDIVELNIPSGIPLVYELDRSLKPLKNYYLGDPEAAKRAAEAVAKQGSRA